MSTGEFAIQDGETGEWWSFESGGHPQGRWSMGLVTRYPTYAHAACSVAFSSKDYARSAARIVPAPPPEMTDAECWEWFSESDHLLALIGNNDKDFGVYNLASLMSGDSEDFHAALVASGTSPCDAIRAARKARGE